MVNKESDTEFHSVVQMTMMAAKAHHQAAVCCLEYLHGRPVDASIFHFATVAAELLLHSIEQSLKLTLALGQVPTEELSKFDHDIHKLYKEVIGDHTREMDTKGEIVRITNIYTSRYGFTPVNEADIKGCINKHRSSYVSFRYFGVPKNFSSVPSWKLDWDDLRLLACLCPSLIEINICQATKSGIRVQPSLRQNGATKGINFTFKMAE